MAEAAPSYRSLIAWNTQARNSAARLLQSLAALPLQPAWVLVSRELKGMARQPQIFWIRVVGAGLGIATLAFLFVGEVRVGASLGHSIFLALNRALYFTILLIGPVITADCLAVEKREGTLGLLFLTPLRPRDIVLAKTIASALRALTLFLAIIPMMALPVVFGGVPAKVLFPAMFTQLAALCLALSAGILASTIHREFIQAAVWSIIYCLVLSFAAFLLGAFLWPVFKLLTSNPATLPLGILFSQLLIIATGLTVMLLVLGYSCRNLRSRWERESQDFKPPVWVSLFSETELRAIFRWDTRKARTTHPIAWLQEYSWTARLAKWGWCALALIGELIAAFSGLVHRGYHPGHLILTAVVVLGIALAGANSFRTERLTGAIELLLVAPLSPLKIMSGRLWGIWVHFFPAVAIIAFTWILAGPLINARPIEASLLLSSYLFLPMIGLYISIFPWNVLVAWIAIYILGAVLPFMIGLSFRHQLPPNYQITLIIAIQALLGISSAVLIWHKLQNRTFVFPNSRVD